MGGVCQTSLRFAYFSSRVSGTLLAPGTYIKELKKLAKAELLILDDFGLQAIDSYAREALMKIIDDRFNKSSTIVSSQIPVSAWYDIIGEGTVADAIL
ncbi:MAG TPA: ATP-binding protein, partial [Bacteroidales bacterium]|nr:ATP-binding protein [Bacteroidales bacterium]